MGATRFPMAGQVADKHTADTDDILVSIFRKKMKCWNFTE